MDWYFGKKRQLKSHYDRFVSYKQGLMFCFSQENSWWTEVMLSTLGLCVITVMFFISCLDSHSDGTHSLQSIHWWASDIMVKLSKSVPIKIQSHLHLVCTWEELASYIYEKCLVKIVTVVGKVTQKSEVSSMKCSYNLLVSNAMQFKHVQVFLNVATVLDKYRQLLIIYVERKSEMDERK